MIKQVFTIAAVFSVCAGAACAETAPPDLARAMLDAAHETGEAAQIAAVAHAAKAVFPDDAESIDAYAAHLIADLTPPESPAATATTSEGKEKKREAGLFALAPWAGRFAASASAAAGNSENSAVGVDIDARREAGAFAHNIKGYVDLGRSQGATTQKRWGASYKLDYNFTERAYAYTRFSYDEDQFSGFDYRLFAGAGAGVFLFKSEPFTSKLEGGPGFQYSPIDDSRLVEQEFALYGASETDWLIREGLVFEQDFAATWTEPTLTFVSKSALTTALTKSLSTGVSFEYRYETSPPAGRENADRIIRANLKYGF